MPESYQAEVTFNFEEFNDDRAKQEIKRLLEGYDVETIILYRQQDHGSELVGHFSGNDIEEW